jgi:hypothetical protein
MREARAELVGPASDRFVADNYPAFEQQLFNVAQAQLKAKIPAHSATDNGSWKTVTVIKRFCIRNQTILRDRHANVTKPSRHDRLPVERDGLRSAVVESVKAAHCFSIRQT